MVDDHLGRSLDPKGTSFSVYYLGSGEAIQMLPCLSMGTLMVVSFPLSQLLCMISHLTQPWVHVVQFESLLLP